MYEFTDPTASTGAAPEGTASIVRAFVQHHPLVPFKAWYVTPAFRHERAQALRYRSTTSSHRGDRTEDPDLDVEVITVAHDFFRGSDSSFELKLNSMATPNAGRPTRAARRRPGRAAGELCDEHGERFGSNPLRVLDCKKPECRKATADVPGSWTTSAARVRRTSPGSDRASRRALWPTYSTTDSCGVRLLHRTTSSSPPPLSSPPRTASARRPL